MISLTRLNGESIVVNVGVIETVEATPDTVVSLASGRKLMVRESLAIVIERVTEFYRQVGQIPVIPPDEHA